MVLSLPLLLLLSLLPTLHFTQLSTRCEIPGKPNAFHTVRALGKVLNNCGTVVLTANFEGVFVPRVKEGKEAQVWAPKEGICYVYVGDDMLKVEKGGGGKLEKEGGGGGRGGGVKCWEAKGVTKMPGVKICGGWLVVKEKRENHPFPTNQKLSLRILKILMLSFFPKVGGMGWVDTEKGWIIDRKKVHTFRMSTFLLALGKSEIDPKNLYSTAFRLEANTPKTTQCDCLWLEESLKHDETASSNEAEERALVAAIKKVWPTKTERKIYFHPIEHLGVFFRTYDDPPPVEPEELQFQQHTGKCFGDQSVRLPRECPFVPAHIISFPKSGRTWLRCIISSLFQHSKGKNITSIPLDKLDKLPNSIIFSHGNTHPYRMTAERVMHLKSSTFFPQNPVIYLARDPRDVSVSNYYEMKTRNLDQFVYHIKEISQMNFSQFVRYSFGSFTTNVAMMNAWGSFEKDGSCPRLIVYYENLHSPQCWLSEYEKVASFLGIFPTREGFGEVKNRCNFDVLSHEIDSIEEEGKEGLNKRWVPVEGGDANSKKVRKGEVGGYLEEASPEDVEFMERHAHFISEFKDYESKIEFEDEDEEERKENEEQ